MTYPSPNSHIVEAVRCLEEVELVYEECYVDQHVRTLHIHIER